MKFEILGKKFLLIYKIKNKFNDKVSDSIKKQLDDILTRNKTLKVSKKEPKSIIIMHQKNEYLNIYLELNINLATNDKTLFTLNIDNKEYKLEEIYIYHNINSIWIYLNMDDETISEVLAFILATAENVPQNATKKDIQKLIINYNPDIAKEQHNLNIIIESIYKLIEDRKELIE